MQIKFVKKLSQSYNELLACIPALIFQNLLCAAVGIDGEVNFFLYDDVIPRPLTNEIKSDLKVVLEWRCGE